MLHLHMLIRKIFTLKNLNIRIKSEFLAALYNLLFSGSIVFNTQPQAVTSMLVHVHIPTWQCMHLYCYLQHVVYVR